jgi:hypothetical protein
MAVDGHSSPPARVEMLVKDHSVWESGALEHREVIACATSPLNFPVRLSRYQTGQTIQWQPCLTYDRDFSMTGL